MIIDSATNKNVILLKKLKDKKYREQFGRYLLEGERLIKSALDYNVEIEKFFVRESMKQEYDFSSAIVLSNKLFDSISDTVNSQGIIAQVKIQQKEISFENNCLILDNVRDPGNVGTLLRTAAATGYKTVFLCSCADVYSPKVVRSAMSAHFSLDLHCLPLENVISMVKNHMPLFCADMNGKNVFEHKFVSRHALLLGNEANGISEISRQSADEIVSLPMENSLESLNVSVAGSVLMYLLRY